MLLQSLEAAYEYQINYERKVEEAATYLEQRIGERNLEFGIILGSGLGGLTKLLTGHIKGGKVIGIPYKDIPHFPQPTAPGHRGKLWIGKLESIDVVCLEGRKHYYEVADAPLNTGILQVIFPVHVLANLGMPNLFVTNAAGGLNHDYKKGDVMIIQSDLTVGIPNPLLGRLHNFKKVDRKTPVERFVPRTGSYDNKYQRLLIKATEEFQMPVHCGTYAAMAGPTYESEAEIASLRAQGIDAVGMSTVPEVIVARSRGMRVVGFSLITNEIPKDDTNPTSEEEVLSAAQSTNTRRRLTNIVSRFFSFYAQNRPKR